MQLRQLLCGKLYYVRLGFDSNFSVLSSHVVFHLLLLGIGRFAKSGLN